MNNKRNKSLIKYLKIKLGQNYDYQKTKTIYNCYIIIIALFLFLYMKYNMCAASVTLNSNGFFCNKKL